MHKHTCRCCIAVVLRFALWSLFCKCRFRDGCCSSYDLYFHFITMVINITVVIIIIFFIIINLIDVATVRPVGTEAW